MSRNFFEDQLKQMGFKKVKKIDDRIILIAASYDRYNYFREIKPAQQQYKASCKAKVAGVKVMVHLHSKSILRIGQATTYEWRVYDREGRASGCGWTLEEARNNFIINYYMRDDDE